MSSLWVTEYSGTAREREQIFQAPAQGRQLLTIGTELKSAKFGPTTHIVRLAPVGAACIYIISEADSLGNYQTASTTVGDPLADGSVECIGVKPNMKISVISTTGS